MPVEVLKADESVLKYGGKRAKYADRMGLLTDALTVRYMEVSKLGGTVLAIAGVQHDGQEEMDHLLVFADLPDVEA